MFLSRGDRPHQRTSAACEWASIAVTRAALSSFGSMLSGPALVGPRSAELCARAAPMVDALNARAGVPGYREEPQQHC